MNPVFAGQAASLAAGQVISTVTDIFNRAGNLSGPKQSLVSINAAARVEPLCIIDDQCINLEYTVDILQSIQSIFCGYYLSALKWCIDPNTVRTVAILNTLNPNRSAEVDKQLKGLGKQLSTTISSLEAYSNNHTMALESYKYKLPKATEDMTVTGATADKAGNDLLTNKASMVVGKLLNVTLSQPNASGQGSTTIDLPIAIRLMVNQVGQSTIDAILTGGEDRSLIERFHNWRSGRIGFWKDLVLCQDLIAAQKKAMLDDKTGVVREIVSRNAKSTTAGLISGNRTISEISNLVVISDQTATRIENSVGGKFSAPNFREKMMNKAGIMILAIVDREWERVTFYHHGISTGTEVGVRDLKVSNRGNGPDIGDILKAFIEGKQPSL